jgi:chromosome segregation ATPase
MDDLIRQSDDVKAKNKLIEQIEQLYDERIIKGKIKPLEDTNVKLMKELETKNIIIESKNKDLETKNIIIESKNKELEVLKNQFNELLLSNQELSSKIDQLLNIVSRFSLSG